MATEINEEIREYTFYHTRNGIVYNDDDYYPMIEFKIKMNDANSNKMAVFQIVDLDSDSAWFCMMPGENNYQLMGPVIIDPEQKEKQIVDDWRFDNLLGREIESISNDPSSIIDHDDIPNWMLKTLDELVEFRYIK